MRYFGSLNEEEWVGDLRSSYRYGDNNLIRMGATYKDKSRTFRSTRFYYDVSRFNPEIEDIYQTSSFMGYDHIANGDISIIRDQQPMTSMMPDTPSMPDLLMQNIIRQPIS